MWCWSLIGEETQGLAGERHGSDGSTGGLGEVAHPPVAPPNPGISGASMVAEEP